MKRNVNCPYCKNEIPINELMIESFENEIREKLNFELKSKQEALALQQEEYNQLLRQVMQKQESVDEIINSKVNDELLQRQQKLKESITAEVMKEKSEQIQLLEDTLVKKSKELREANASRAKIIQLQADLEEKEVKLQLQFQEKLNKKLAEANETFRNQANLEHDLRLKEKEELIQKLKEELDHSRRRIENSSQQLSGEALEKSVEEMLQMNFPDDQVTEIGKGISGGDSILHVMVNHKLIGRILFECKNTNNFSQQFISKVKEDAQRANCDLAVIISRTMPKKLEGNKIGVIDGVWICQDIETARSLTLGLRFGLLQVSLTTMQHQNKDDKKEMLYSYLTSSSFKQLFEQILNNFEILEKTFSDEEKKLTALWKIRRAQLNKALQSVLNFYGDIKGISDNIPSIPSLLEFPLAS